MADNIIDFKKAKADKEREAKQKEDAVLYRQILNSIKHLDYNRNGPTSLGGELLPSGGHKRTFVNDPLFDSVGSYFDEGLQSSMSKLPQLTVDDLCTPKEPDDGHSH